MAGNLERLVSILFDVRTQGLSDISRLNQLFSKLEANSQKAIKSVRDVSKLGVSTRISPLDQAQRLGPQTGALEQGLLGNTAAAVGFSSALQDIEGDLDRFTQPTNRAAEAMSQYAETTTSSISFVSKGIGALGKDYSRFSKLASTTQLAPFDTKTQLSRINALSAGIDQTRKSIEAAKRESTQFRTAFSLNFLSALFVGQALQRLFTRIAATTVSTFREIADSSLSSNQALTLLIGSMEFLKFTVGNAIATALEPLIPSLVTTIEKVADWIQQNPELTTTLIALGAGVGFVSAQLASLVLLSAGLLNVLAVLGFNVSLVSNAASKAAIAAGAFSGALTLLFLAGSLLSGLRAVINFTDFAVTGDTSSLVTGITSLMASAGLILAPLGKRLGFAGLLLISAGTLIDFVNFTISGKDLSLLDFISAAFGGASIGLLIGRIAKLSPTGRAISVGISMFVVLTMFTDLAFAEEGGLRNKVVNFFRGLGERAGALTTEVNVDEAIANSVVTEKAEEEVKNKITTFGENSTMEYIQVMEDFLASAESKNSDVNNTVSSLFGEDTNANLSSNIQNLNETATTQVELLYTSLISKAQEKQDILNAIVTGIGDINNQTVETTQIPFRTVGEQSLTANLDTSLIDTTKIAELQQQFIDGEITVEQFNDQLGLTPGKIDSLISSAEQITTGLDLTDVGEMFNANLTTPLQNSNTHALNLTENLTLLSEAISGEEGSFLTALDAVVDAQNEFITNMEESIPLAADNVEAMDNETSAAKRLTEQLTLAAVAQERLNRARLSAERRSSSKSDSRDAKNRSQQPKGTVG